jgi:hypothetical protein
MAALITHQAAFTSLMWGRAGADTLLIGVMAGWTWLLGLHVAVRRPSLKMALWPIALLAVLTWAYDFSESARWVARAHALVMVMGLMIIGWIWPRTRYRITAAVAAAADVAFYSLKWITTGRNPAASMVILTGFLLLILGAAIGWHKTRLLEMCRQPEPPDRPKEDYDRCAVFGPE